MVGSFLFMLEARVAKLADALDSGSSGRKVVQVRVLSRARKFERICGFL